MELINRVIDNLEKRREKVLKGGINCIPNPFKNFRRDYPGIEQGQYILMSGATKSAKTQITNFMFLYTPLLYAYYHPDQVRVKIFYFPLEETPDNITIRFISYLLYTLSGYKIRISPTDLKSTNKDKVLDPEILNILRSIEYQSILEFYEKNVLFMSDRNATGVWKVLNRYAEEAGIIHKKKILIENSVTGVKQEREVFDYYEPKDPDEYVIIIYDHVSLIERERGMDLRESINKLSEYMMILRNKYQYIPVVVQQQNTETTNLEAFKNDRIRPTEAGLEDSKHASKDCSIMFGITNPSKYGIPKYPNTIQSYDITRLRGYARFLEVVINRNGEANGLLPLYFDGAVNYFSPLPRPNDTVKLSEIYKLIRQNQGN